MGVGMALLETIRQLTDKFARDLLAAVVSSSLDDIIPPDPPRHLWGKDSGTGPCALDGLKVRRKPGRPKVRVSVVPAKQGSTTQRAASSMTYNQVFSRPEEGDYALLTPDGTLYHAARKRDLVRRCTARGIEVLG